MKRQDITKIPLLFSFILSTSIYASSEIHPAASSDQVKSLEQIHRKISAVGLKKSNLIIGLDFTASNFNQGEKTFHGRNLHKIVKKKLNPYQAAISIIAENLASLDEDQIFPVYRFGDKKTKNQKVLPLTRKMPLEGYKGFGAIQKAYTKASKRVTFYAPTSFAPLINKAVETIICHESGGEYPYHILLILTDGEITSEWDLNIQAIQKASKYPLSIIAVGVGDGPWKQMKKFDDKVTGRDFDNFQFVCLHEFINDLDTISDQEKDDFAAHALQEIPSQYQKIKELELLKAKPLEQQSNPEA